MLFSLAEWKVLSPLLSMQGDEMHVATTDESSGAFPSWLSIMEANTMFFFSSFLFKTPSCNGLLISTFPGNNFAT
jgi:hypothetical protein